MLLDATDKELKEFRDVLALLKGRINKNLSYDIEFLITNQDVKLMDVKVLIEHLTDLLNRYENIRKKNLEKLYPHASSETGEEKTKNGDNKNEHD